jgi:serine/threonine-protein kinase
MGAVYVAEHTLLGRRAAIKVLLPALSQHEEVVHRFFNEARAVTRITDPGIVQVFDFGFHTDGSAFIVMELLEGEPLDHRLARLGRIAPMDVLRTMRQLATSLHAAHAKGIIHRDLKPENIFLVGDPAVTGGERAKILDFGIAKLTADEPGKLKTRTNMVMGTPVYMSPEQCRGAGSVDLRSDIYSLGCVMMTMLTGRPPFEAEGSGELIAAHLREPAPLASSRIAGLPDVLDNVLLRCLAKAPDERFQTMAELAETLAAAEQLLLHASTPTVAGPLPAYVAAGLTPPPAARTPTPAPPVAGAPTPTTLGAANGQAVHGARPRRGLAVLAAGVVVLAGAALFAVTRSHHTPAPAAVETPAAKPVAPVASVVPVAATPTPDAPPAPPAPPPDAQHVTAPPRVEAPVHVVVQRPPARRHTIPSRHVTQGGTARVQPAGSDLGAIDRGD